MTIDDLRQYIDKKYPFNDYFVNTMTLAQDSSEFITLYQTKFTCANVFAMSISPYEVNIRGKIERYFAVGSIYFRWMHQGRPLTSRIRLCHSYGAMVSPLWASKWEVEDKGANSSLKEKGYRSRHPSRGLPFFFRAPCSGWDNKIAYTLEPADSSNPSIRSSLKPTPYFLRSLIEILGSMRGIKRSNREKTVVNNRDFIEELIQAGCGEEFLKFYTIPYNSLEQTRWVNDFPEYPSIQHSTYANIASFSDESLNDFYYLV